jgi:hypothetical protein
VDPLTCCTNQALSERSRSLRSFDVSWLVAPINQSETNVSQATALRSSTSSAMVLRRAEGAEALLAYAADALLSTRWNASR